MNALELLAIEKSFGGVQALRGADLSAKKGEILGLCGENGAGKSTMLKVLSGVYPAASYRGVVRVRGEEQRFSSTKDAQKAGIAIVHQELMLVPELSVAANLMLGRERGAWGLVDDDAMEAEAQRLLDKFGVSSDIAPDKPIGLLGIGLQQVVEIVRALSHEASILILDEPTAALTHKESDRLMAWLRDLRDAGTTCIYVSHRMDEVFSLCDRITVLRDGKTVGTVEASSAAPDDVVAMMVGRSLAGKDVRARALGAKAGAPVLDVREFSVRLPGKTRGEEGARTFAVEKMSFSVKPGEVVAVAGAMGSGRTALLSSLFGCAKGKTSGSVWVDGKEIGTDSPRDAVAAGLALVPEDRKGTGLVLGMTVAENLTLPPARSAIARFFEWLAISDEEDDEQRANARIAELSIRGGPSAETVTLSGGNQQKIVVGKWLGAEKDADAIRVLLLDEPTRGVDVGAREEIYALIEKLTEKGLGVVLASSDLPEVLRLSHRILVLRHGRVVGELDGRTTTEEAIVKLATFAAEPLPVAEVA